MQTDREMLVRAAKAYFGPACVFGIVTKAQADAGEFWVNGNLWNPLTDDGDALRLAVKFDLLTQDGTYSYEPDEWRIDPYAATRRAIVRAAAALAPQPNKGEAK